MTAKSPRKKVSQRNATAQRSTGMQWLSYIAVAIAAVLLVVLVGLGRQYFANHASSTHSVILPNFVGEQLAQAQNEAQQAHVTLHVFYIASDQTKNSILDQNPEGGILVPITTVVNLAVSTGPGNVVVPDVSALTVAAACQQLLMVELHCNRAAIIDPTSILPQGEVTRTNPPAGTAVNPTSIGLITLYVSAGAPTAAP